MNDDRYPGPGTPAIADILLAVGSLAVYATDTLIVKRSRSWNYWRVSLSDQTLDGGSMIAQMEACEVCRSGTK